MSKPSFKVYVDESGDEGFVFNSDGSGSSRWLVLSAVVVRAKDDLALVKLVGQTRIILGRKPGQHLHFSDLKHEQRVPYIRLIAAASLQTVSIAIYKPGIPDPVKFQAEKFLLYRHATRLLLERVSWLCRDIRVAGEGDGTAEIIFSNRSIMSYEGLREHLKWLQSKSDSMDVRIDWSVVVPDAVRAVNHEQLAGLQVADAVASGVYYATNLNRYGESEDKYARLLLPSVYRHKNVALGYGFKFWPEAIEKIKSANPHIAWFTEI